MPAHPNAAPHISVSKPFPNFILLSKSIALRGFRKVASRGEGNNHCASKKLEAAMAQSCWVMQGVGALGQKPLLECGRAGVKELRRRAQQQVKCSVEDDGKTKKIPVRLPGGRQMPTYGSSGGGGFAKSPPGLGQFRPPSLFGAPQVEDISAEQVARIESLLDQIRSGYGTWHERATGITELQSMGMGSEEVYEKAFVPASTQTSLVVAAQVYQSMVQVGCSPDVLSWFDESKVDILYALRTLSAQQRKLAAEYVKDNDLEPPGAQELARAIKDHERRPQGREGFAAVPGDCLAFSLHRAAGETTNAEERSVVVERGLSVAVTESAKQRFSEYL